MAAEAQSPVRILTDFIAVVRAWAMEVVCFLDNLMLTIYHGNIYCL